MSGEWSMLLRLERENDAGFDDEEIKHQVIIRLLLVE
jgi:hypothetical protein